MSRLPVSREAELGDDRVRQADPAASRRVAHHIDGQVPVTATLEQQIQAFQSKRSVPPVADHQKPSTGACLHRYNGRRMFELRPIQQHARFNSSTIAILLILMAAFALRVYDLDWDEGHYLHPDERFVADVITNRIIPEWPPDFDNLLDPEHSLLNPRSVNPDTGTHRDFAYGSLPLFVTDLAATLLSRTTEMIGRPTSAISTRSVDSCPRFSTR